MTARSGIAPLVLLIGAIALAACGGPGTSTAPGGTTGAVATVPATSEAPIDPIPPFPSFDLGSFGIPSFSLPSGDKDLEALLPDELGGETVQKLSMTGDSFLGGNLTGTEQLDDVLEQAGKGPADLSVAFGGAGTVVVIAYRIKGVPADTFYDAFLLAGQQAGEVTVTDASFGGKTVKKLVSPTTEIGTVYVYASGDVLFVVGGTISGISDAILNEAFSKIS
jgi:hypothetical protein